MQVKYQHTPGGTADLYLYPGQTPQRQGTLVQREAVPGMLLLIALLTCTLAPAEVDAAVCR